MNKAQIAIFICLVVAAFAQNDINVGPGKGTRVGGWEEVDLTNFESAEDQNLVNEAVERSRMIYEEDSENNKWGELDEVLSVKRQVVSGLLYKILWSTVNGEKVEISVHQVPWIEEPQKRYPKL